MSTILVCGATGTQGSQVVSALLNHGFKVHTLIRDTTTTKARLLSQSGAQNFQGDFSNYDSVLKAMIGCTGLFLNVLPSPVPDLEVSQARTLLAAAKATPTLHTLIYSSVAMAGQHTSFPNWGPSHPQYLYWTSKATIEALVSSVGFDSWTILQPAFLMQNFIPPKSDHLFPGLTSKHVLAVTYAPETSLALVDAADIAAFALAAFVDPARYHGEVLALAAEELTSQQIAGSISEATGLDIGVRYLRTKEEAVEYGYYAPVVDAQLWSNDVGYKVDFTKLQKYGVSTTPLRKFLRDNRDVVLKAYLS